MKKQRENLDKILTEIKSIEPVKFTPLQTTNGMLYSRKMVRGYVMKKVESASGGILQTQYHKRKLILDFDIFPSLTLQVNENLAKKDIAVEKI